jgi:hypothetical protein
LPSESMRLTPVTATAAVFRHAGSDTPRSLFAHGVHSTHLPHPPSPDKACRHDYLLTGTLRATSLRAVPGSGRRTNVKAPLNARVELEDGTRSGN